MSDYLHDLSLKLIWSRDMDKPHDFRFGPVSNPFFVIWFVKEGRRKVEIDQSIVHIGPGDIVVFSPNKKYRLLPEEESDRRVRYFSVGCSVTVGAFDLSELFTIPAALPAISSEQQPGLHREWEQVHRSHEAAAARKADPDADTLTMQASAHASLYRWFALLMTIVRPQPIVVSPFTDERILQTCQLIQLNLHQPLTLEGLSRQVFLSPGHLSYLFNQALRMSPMAYVRKQRMKRAKQLLLNTSLSIREIGVRVGYEDQGRFSRLFRSAEGCSPLQYRRRWQPH